MKKEKTNWVKNLSKKQVILFGVAWFIGALLLILSSTNLFTESLFQRRYMATNVLMLLSTITFAVVLISYLKKK
ncbi:hypothetical protein KRX57_09650 [Weeksellaceae bacterium TAE3-ERU29]|nr:hypothetical protein [Weeksellaceae bacterium TAE3-ERU29]